MKRYKIGWVYQDESKDGEWIKYTDHEAEIKKLKEHDLSELLELIDQNHEMLEMLKRLMPLVEKNLKDAVKENFGYVGNDEWAINALDKRDDAKNLIEKVEKENSQ